MTKASLISVAAFIIVLAVEMSISLDSVRFQGLEDASFHFTPKIEESMSSCMLIMDDNHWLVEWLAYHHATLNLRHIIVALDPRSKTSPISILSRWKSRIHFELWNDSYYFENHPGQDVDLQEVNLARQQTFIAKCMQEYKRRNHSWVIFTDTDEFIAINPRTKQQSHELYREYSPPIDQPGSILQFLRHEQETRGTVCFTMGRLQYSPDESPLSQVEKNVPHYLNASQFLTLRWLRPADNLVGPKNILFLRGVDTILIPSNFTHQHRVIYEKCGKAGHTWHEENSLLQVHHYLGTLEQHEFRNDARQSFQHAGRNERFRKYRGMGSNQTREDLRPWIKAFISIVGKQEAIRLLGGVGRTEGWESADTHARRFADEPCCVSTSAEQKMKERNRNRKLGAGRNVVYSVARTDRSGAAIADMLLAHAYAFNNNMIYGGACSEAYLPHQRSTEQLIEAVGLQDLLQYACPMVSDGVSILDRKKYVGKNTRIFTQDYLKYLHSRVKYPTTKNHSIVVHVRRGDITPCGFYANRYLPNSHYTTILEEYVPSNLPVSIFSEADTFESFDDFSNYSVFLNSDLSEAWKAMVTADYIVLSKSSFSFVPAILNPNATVIYTPFMQMKLPRWKAVSKGIMENSTKRVLEMVDQRCSPEETHIALWKLSG